MMAHNPICVLNAGSDSLRRGLVPFARLPTNRSTDPNDPGERYWKQIFAVEDCVGNALFESRDLDELDVALQTLLEDPSYCRLLRELYGMTTFEMVVQSTAEHSPPPRLLSGAGRGRANRVRRANMLMAATSSAVVQVIGWLAKQHGSAAGDEDAGDSEYPASTPSPSRSPDNLIWFLTDPDMPPALKEAFFDRAVGDASMFAIGAANDRAIPDWMKEALLDRWEAGLTHYLRFLAACPGAAVSEDCVPKADVLDVDMLQAEHEHSSAAYETNLQRAKLSGLDVFPPLAQDA